MNPSTLWRRLAPLVAAFALHGTAQAGAGTLTTSVTRLQDSVTYSDPTLRKPLNTVVGYKVEIANIGGNTINNIRFTASASVTETAESALLSSIDGNVSCTVSADKKSLDCTIGQLRAGASAPTFAVFFTAPAKAPGSTVPNGLDGQCTTTDCVAFRGITYYAEGTGGINSPPDNSIAEWGPVYTPLGTNNPNFVRSAVQKSGATIFTGKSGAPVVDTANNYIDPFATTVEIPAGATYTTAQIDEQTFIADAVTCGGSGALRQTCYRTNLSVPGTFTVSPYLRITLRLDASAVPLSTTNNKPIPIASIQLSYKADGSITEVPINQCGSATTPTGTGVPCWAERKVYGKSGPKSTWDPNLDGDYEWILINTHNGSAKIF